MNLLISTPVFDGETIEFPLVLAFEYAIKLRNLDTMCQSQNLFIQEFLKCFENPENIVLFEKISQFKIVA